MIVLSIVLGVLLFIAVVAMVLLVVRSNSIKLKAQLQASGETESKLEELSGRLSEEWQKRMTERDDRWQLRLNEELVDFNGRWWKFHNEGLEISRGSVSGKIFEAYCPLAPEYANEYNMRDIVAVFDTFDYLMLKGRSDGEIVEIEFQEMKTGGGTLNDDQKSLRDAIRSGVKVSFVQWRMNKDTGKWHKVKSR